MLSARKRKRGIGVIDIFAGPGGLGEGFSSFEEGSGIDRHPFELAVSAEMELSAHATLRLRAFYRLLLRQMGEIPQDYWSFLEIVAEGSAPNPAEYFGNDGLRKLWLEAETEAMNLTLGRQADNRALFERIRSVKDKYEEMILIGGPPCQAYSLVGRARQKNVKGFRTKGDTKHFLYQQYLGILAEFKPAVFIMENVKGILTSKVGRQEMFSAIRDDLSNPCRALGIHGGRNRSTDRYVLLPIHVPSGEARTEERVAEDPSGFVIRCEDHGVPQARHRVIIMGVRSDCIHPSIGLLAGLPIFSESKWIEHALAGLPSLRSGLSREADDRGRWLCAMEEERHRVIRLLGRQYPKVTTVLRELIPAHTLPRRSVRYASRTAGWATRKQQQSVVLNHETRGHMKSDLGRYMFSAAFAIANGHSPTSRDFPIQLAPAHANWSSGAFADRFRVQVRGRPSNTITSHLSKDGHAFIHWDPRQCRSLTVREAARLQTFPDDYLFIGNRTEQYVQVGNAVPPLIAREIARVVWSILKG